MVRKAIILHEGLTSHLNGLKRTLANIVTTRAREAACEQMFMRQKQVQMINCSLCYQIGTLSTGQLAFSGYPHLCGSEHFMGCCYSIQGNVHSTDDVSQRRPCSFCATGLRTATVES